MRAVATSVSALLLLLSFPAGAAAQTAPDANRQPAALIIGLAVESNRGQIDDFLPAIRQNVSRELSRDNIRMVPLAGPRGQLREQAEKAGCGYLLDIQVWQASGIEGGFGGPTPEDPTVPVGDSIPALKRWHDMMGDVRVEYRVHSLTAPKMKINGQFRVDRSQWPVGVGPQVLQALVSREVRAAAGEAVRKLQSGKLR